MPIPIHGKRLLLVLSCALHGVERTPPPPQERAIHRWCHSHDALASDSAHRMCTRSAAPLPWLSRGAPCGLRVSFVCLLPFPHLGLLIALRMLELGVEFHPPTRTCRRPPAHRHCRRNAMCVIECDKAVTFLRLSMLAKRQVDVTSMEKPQVSEVRVQARDLYSFDETLETDAPSKRRWRMVTTENKTLATVPSSWRLNRLKFQWWQEEKHDVVCAGRSLLRCNSSVLAFRLLTINAFILGGVQMFAMPRQRFSTLISSRCKACR